MAHHNRRKEYSKGIPEDETQTLSPFAHDIAFNDVSVGDDFECHFFGGEYRLGLNARKCKPYPPVIRGFDKFIPINILIVRSFNLDELDRR